MMPSIQHLLDIPELRLLIARLLTLQSRRACALVCKEWHRDMQPFVWETFCVAVRKDLDKVGLKEQRAISIGKHGHHIRHLRWPAQPRWSRMELNRTLQTLSQSCRSLSSLVARCLDHSEWYYCRELIRHNPDLQQVELRSSELVEKANKFFAQPALDMAWVALWHQAGLASLRRLVYDCWTSLSALASVVDACPALEDLVVGGGVLAEEPPSAAAAAADNLLSLHRFRLKKLQLEGDCLSEQLGNFLLLCPKLHTLILNKLSVSIRDAVCQVIRTGHLAQLSSLALGSGLTDKGLHRAFLDALPPHQLEKVHFQDIPAQDVRLLIQRQHRSLVDIYLDLDSFNAYNPGDTDDQPLHHHGVAQGGLSHYPEAVVLDILTTCSHLRELTIEPGSDRAIDIRFLIAKPWVCTEMEALQIPLGLDDSCTNELLCEQASAEKHRAAVEHAPFCSTIGLAEYLNQRFLAPCETAEGAEDFPPPPPRKPRAESEQCEMVLMQRLGQLRKLRKLNLESVHHHRRYRHRYREYHQRNGLTWTMDNGLGYLSDLKALTYLNLGPSRHRQGSFEMQFMQDHWPNLAEFRYGRIISLQARQWLTLNWPGLKVVVVGEE